MSKAAEKIAYHYIIINPKIHGGEPIIKNTRFPVRSVVYYIIKQGMLPEELAQEFPQLSLAAIHEALSYYYENKEEIEDLIEKNSESSCKK